MTPDFALLPVKHASRLAFLLGVLTLAAMLMGILLISALGGTSGRDLGADATGEAFVEAASLLILAEVLKVMIGTCQVMLVQSAVGVQVKWRTGALLSGYAAAALIAASGITGLYAVYAQSRGLGGIASALAFGSAAATAGWVIIFVGSAILPLRPWHRRAGLAFAAASLVSIMVGPAALGAGLLGLVWWFGLSRAFMSTQAVP